MDLGWAVNIWVDEHEALALTLIGFRIGPDFSSILVNDKPPPAQSLNS